MSLIYFQPGGALINIDEFAHTPCFFGALLTGEPIDVFKVCEERQEKQPHENVEKRIYQGQPYLVKKYPDIVNITADSYLTVIQQNIDVALRLYSLLESPYRR